MKFFGRKKSMAALLEAPLDTYTPVALPNTDTVRMINPQWLATEMKSGRPPQLRLALADEVAMQRVDEHHLGPEIRDLTEACLERLHPTDRPVLRSSTFDAVFTGVACALLEESSGLQQPGVMHPSVANALRIAGLEEKQNTLSSANIILDKAREGGYFWMRHREVAPDQVFERCNFDE